MKTKILRKNRPTFCTECGKELDEFWLTPDADSVRAIEKKAAECHKTGKINGVLCSRWFIAEPDSFKSFQRQPTTKTAKLRVAKLKKNVMKQIRAQQ